MKKTAFLYPGQGAQKMGMGQEFYEQSRVARAVFDTASRILELDFEKLCFTENDLLDRTDFTQIALLVTCMAMTEEIRQQGLSPDITAGLSLGEYTAICAAGGMSFEDALKTVWLRGNLMQQADEGGQGAMAAVLGLSGEKVCAITDSIEGVSVANYNCPGQIVITGEKSSLERAGRILKEAGARRIMPLKVSGAFHSPYMKDAGEKLRKHLDQICWKKLSVPYVSNVSAGVITDTAGTASLLQQQISAPVRWEQSIRSMREWGVDCFVEIGPGATLSRFMARIDRSAEIYTVSTPEELGQVIPKLIERAQA